MTAEQRNAIEQHGKNLLELFPDATERDPVELCKKLRRIEAKGAAIALRLCNGPQFSEGESERLTDKLKAEANKLLGNANEYQPKTGAKCSCKRGVMRDNCPTCEGTGMVVDFQSIRNRHPLVPVFLNMDPRGYCLKIDDEWMRTKAKDSRLHRDWGGYGILAPEIGKDGN